ncbi:hypothetical protein B0H13DRAFT_2312282 [Mycena leptocephala]|nr:hypothetical protein B0H13DRAFT_2312282 [Mycena leptocephala]
MGGPHLNFHVQLLQRHPSGARVTVVDFKHDKASVFVRLVEEERAEDIYGDVNWDDHIARAASSGGRMELHLSIVPDGHKPRRWMFPQRSDSSAVHDGLIRIAKEVPLGSEATKEIQELLERNKGMRMIH